MIHVLYNDHTFMYELYVNGVLIYQNPFRHIMLEYISELKSFLQLDD